MDKLRALLERLTVEYKAKKSAMDNTLGSNNAGQTHPVARRLPLVDRCRITSDGFDGVKHSTFVFSVAIRSLFCHQTSL